VNDSNDALQAILHPAGLPSTLFPPTSRYYGIEATTLVTAEGATIVYLRRRLVPSPERFALLQEHVVAESERLDNVTARYLGDPEQFWRLCDSNAAMRPEELTETAGRRLRITLPEGIPGMPNA
jgi:hypothetical protein